MVKKGAIIIDCRHYRVPDTSKKSGISLKGDVDFSGVASRCSFITHSGGVGPMTIAALMKNTYMASEREMAATCSEYNGSIL